jgi:glyoxylase-like metal-dependent hydrolase (beta-lactamase superfamily II)
MKGQALQVTPNVRAVQVPDNNPMHPQYTTIYLVGRGQVLTIDSGEDMDRYRWMLRGYLAATEKAEIAMSGVSHHHRDHTGNLRWLRDEFQTEVYVPKLAQPLLSDILPETGVSHLPDEGEIEIAGGLKLRLLMTPGHSVDSVCYYLEDEGVLFTGDTILGASTTTIIDLGQYMETLLRLRALPNLKVICPGHGPLIYDPYDIIDDYIRRREVREKEILDLLAEGPPLTSWAMVEKLYQEVDRRLWRAADRVVQTHLRKLQDEGKITSSQGTPRPYSEEDARQAAEEEKRRQAVIAQADEYRAQAARQALMLQEAPPTAQWQEPPLYALSR